MICYACFLDLLLWWFALYGKRGKQL